MKRCGVMIVIGLVALLGSATAALIPPNGAGYWWLGPELITNGSFETDTVGNTPVGWNSYIATYTTTANTGHSSSQSMEYSSSYGGGRLTTGISSSPDQYYRLAFWWQEVSIISGNPGVYGSPVKDGSGTQLFDADGFLNIGVQSETSTNWTGFSQNNRWPGYLAYNATLGNWNFFAATFKTLSDLPTDWANVLQVSFGASQGAGVFRVDDISLRQWVPEPTTGLLMGLLATGLVQVRRRNRLKAA